MNDDAQTDFERQLASLCPASRLDRDRVMFVAGQAAAQPTRQSPHPRLRWFWPAAATVMTVAAGVLAVCLILGPPPRVVRQVVVVKSPGPAAESHKPATADALDLELVEPAVAERRWASSPWDTAGASPRSGLPQPNYFHTRHVALVLGVDALPQRPISSSGSAETPRVRDVGAEGTDAEPSSLIWPW